MPVNSPGGINVSIILPTRHRYVRLLKALNSIYTTADRPNHVEAVVRIHSDDAETIRGIPNLLHFPNMRVIVGRPLKYFEEPISAWEASNVAAGEWLWGFNDDAYVHPRSRGWDSRLMSMRVEKTIVIPEINKLGQCEHPRDGAHPFPFLPNRWWLAYKLDKFWHPTDVFIYNLLRGDGWKTEWLPGVMTVHERRPDKLMKEEGRG